MSKLWKKGRGKLGPFEPLLGSWVADGDSPMGPVHCCRRLEPILGGSYLKLDASWKIGDAEKGKIYEELAIIGVGEAKQVCFWSFTSDGKSSQGVLSDVTDLHEEAIGFEADMPGGRARVAYWPAEDGGFFWVVESKTKKCWNRFVLHHYHKA